MDFWILNNLSWVLLKFLGSRKPCYYFSRMILDLTYVAWCWSHLARNLIYKAEKFSKGSLDSISSPSRSHGHLIFLFLFFRQNIAGCCHQTFCPTSLFTAPSNVLPLHHKPTFLPIIQNFTEGEIFFYFTKL